MRVPAQPKLTVKGQALLASGSAWTGDDFGLAKTLVCEFIYQRRVIGTPGKLFGIDAGGDGWYSGLFKGSPTTRKTVFI